MTTSQVKAARACLSLAYKYTCMRDCVKDQRPELLGDPTLAVLEVQLDALQSAFDKRVKDIADTLIEGDLA